MLDAPEPLERLLGVLTTVRLQACVERRLVEVGGWQGGFLRLGREDRERR